MTQSVDVVVSELHSAAARLEDAAQRLKDGLSGLSDETTQLDQFKKIAEGAHRNYSDAVSKNGQTSTMPADQATTVEMEKAPDPPKWARGLHELRRSDETQ